MVAEIPAAREANRIPIFDMFRSASSLKARVAINNDIVKPIPHSQPAPKICLHDKSEGAVASRVFVDAQAKNHIPRGLPIKSPRATPRLTGCIVAAKKFSLLAPRHWQTRKVASQES